MSDGRFIPISSLQKPVAGSAIPASEFLAAVEENLGPMSVVSEEPRTEEHNGQPVEVTELKIHVGTFRGEEIHVGGCFASNPDRRSEHTAPMLYIPGGHGVIQRDFLAWAAAVYDFGILGVDWIGRGQSSQPSFFDPQPTADALRVPDGDYRKSYQFLNICALLRALTYLETLPWLDQKRLTVTGTSWGGFYSWVLAGLKENIRYLLPSFGTGRFDLELRYLWADLFTEVGETETHQWLDAIDPAGRLANIKAEVFLETATNDKFFSMPSAMATFAAVPTVKNLFLAHNQDHFIHPYGTLVFDEASRMASRDKNHKQVVFANFRLSASGRYIDFDVSNIPEGSSVRLIYSGGSHDESFGRHWRASTAIRQEGISWRARIPVRHLYKNFWCYASLEHAESRLCRSSQIYLVKLSWYHRLAGRLRYNPKYRVPDDCIYNLPVGDGISPEVTTRKFNEFTSINFRFLENSPAKGVVYCLLGDRIEESRHDALEVELALDGLEDPRGYYLCLVQEFHSAREVTVGIPLAAVCKEVEGIQKVSVPFSAMKLLETRPEHKAGEHRGCFDRSRICGIGIYKDREGALGSVAVLSVRTFSRLRFVDGLSD